jgi:RNA polymerase sigma factor for flagellar operon FliA
LIIELYYHEELTLKEIGAVLSISESRVSQLLTALAGKLRLALKDSF